MFLLIEHAALRVKILQPMPNTSQPWACLSKYSYSTRNAFSQNENNTPVIWGSHQEIGGSLFGKQGCYKFTDSGFGVSAYCSVRTFLHSTNYLSATRGKKMEVFELAYFYWESLQDKAFQLSHIILLSLFIYLADFGVSAKNTKTLQRRDSFIGTPYWWVRHAEGQVT